MRAFEPILVQTTEFRTTADTNGNSRRFFVARLLTIDRQGAGQGPELVPKTIDVQHAADVGGSIEHYHSILRRQHSAGLLLGPDRKRTPLVLGCSQVGTVDTLTTPKQWEELVRTHKAHGGFATRTVPKLRGFRLPREKARPYVRRPNPIIVPGGGKQVWPADLNAEAFSSLPGHVPNDPAYTNVGPFRTKRGADWYAGCFNAGTFNRLEWPTIKDAEARASRQAQERMAPTGAE